jgi:hypothetical protein
LCVEEVGHGVLGLGCGWGEVAFDFRNTNGICARQRKPTSALPARRARM